MTTFCTHCDTEFTSAEQQFCGSCGAARPTTDVTPPVATLQRNPTVLLRAQLHKVLAKTEKLAAKDKAEPALETAKTLNHNDGKEQTLAATAGLNPFQVDITAASIKPAVEESNADEVKPFWQCSQCSHLNSHDAEYCDECGAMYVSPEEQAAKAAAKEQAKESLPSEVLAMLHFNVEDGTHPGWRFKTGSGTNEGVLRQGHADEDSVFVLELQRIYQAKPESFGLYVVADGMGGQAAGEVASRNAIEGIAQLAMAELALPWLSGQQFDAPQLEQALKQAALEAHRRVRDWNAANAKDSGSTLTMACLLNGQAAFANVGDSRTYLFRRGEAKADPEAETVKIELTDTAPLPSLENGRRSTDKLKFKGEVRNTELTRPQEEVEEQMLNAGMHAVEPYRAIRVTRDQSLVQELVESGQLAPDDVYTDPRRNVVLNGLGTSDETVPVDTYSRKLEPGDRILLCSDGLWEMVRDPAMAEKITTIPDPQACADELISLACKNGGADNVSVIIVAVER